MTSPPSNPPEPPAPGAEDEERIGELLNEYFDRKGCGETLTKDDFLAENPEHAEILREHLFGLDLIGRMGSSDGRDTLPADPPPRGSSGRVSLQGGTMPPPEIPGYDIVKEVGRGGMGVVFKAMQLSTKRVVGLKVLLEGPLASESSRRRFEREIALAAQLKHPNIIPIYDSGVAGSRMYYAMEYVHGQALGDYLKLQDLSIVEKLRLFVKISRAVAHAHQRGVVHRDVKPSNILIDGDAAPHILDFGLAKAGALGDTTTSITAQVIGTPAYMSPEQAAGDPSAIDTRSDVYSLGVVLYEMLTGKMPYDTSSSIGTALQNIAHVDPTPPRQHHRKIDGELSAIVLKALEKHKDERYQSADSLCTDIESYIAGEPISAKPAGSMYLLRKAIMRHRPVAGIAALLVTFAIITLGLVKYYSGKVEQSQQQVRELVDTVSEKEAEVERHKQTAAVHAGNPEEAEKARRDLEWSLRDMGVDSRRILDPALRELSLSIEAGEDPRFAMVRILMSVVSDMDTQESVEPLSKSPDVDDWMEPQFSPRPRALREDTPGEEPLTKAELMDALKTVERWRRSVGSSPRQRPTTRPAATQPVGTQPAPPEVLNENAGASEPGEP